MSFELFEKERRVIDNAKAMLSEDTITDAQARDSFSTLLKEYQKLFKSSQRLVKMSDRNELQLNALAKSLDEKTKMLEGLSMKLSKYLAPQIYESIFSGTKDVEIKTARKRLTVFFSDIKDFTEITEDLQPEALNDLLNRYFREMSTIALDHGATIDKFIGDAMLMFFGDPESLGHKEDAAACVRMAIAMQRRMLELEPEWAALGIDRPFRMRVGINTGYCNVGNFGSENRMDYTIIGGEVNLAARLESHANPGGILIAHETKALIGNLFDVEQRGEVTCKGIRKPVRAFSVLHIDKEIVQSDDRQETDLPGLSLKLDPSRLSDEARNQAVKALQSALHALNPSETTAAPNKRSRKKAKAS